jgi:hypothetical protein
MAYQELKHYYVLFNEHGLNCGHEHRTENGVKRCFLHYQKYYPNACIIEQWEIISREDRLWKGKL